MKTENNEKPNRTGSGLVDVVDFASFCEGDIEPKLNKRIRTLIDRTSSHIVYLDDDLYVEWAFFGTIPVGFDEVANRIGNLETISITQLTQLQREPFARLLAEAMARILGDRNDGEADAVLDKAEAYLKARGSENARRWYLSGVLWATSTSLAIAAIVLCIRYFTRNAEWGTGLEVAAASAFGSLGTLLSLASRTEAIRVEPVAGPQIHRFEAAIRVVVGVIGALFVAIAIRADLLLGVFHSLSHPFLALIAACVVAGASERLVPSLVNNMGSYLKAKTK
jgi:hypothetical protein